VSGGGRRALVAAGALLAGVAILFAALVQSTFPRKQGSRPVVGISGPVRIETDSRGIVTIRAGGPTDAFYGLGYAHARDRLWQMEFQRRIASGRLAEILGRRLVETDRFLRTIGFRRAASEALAPLPPAARETLEAYSAGVNGFLAAERARPIEFRLLRAEAETFGPVDCLAWAKVMAWDLASGNAANEIRRARFVAAVGAQKAAELFPEVPAEPTIIRDDEWESVSNFAPGATSPAVNSRSRAPHPPPRIPALPWSALERRFAVLDDLGFGGETVGSNSWVLAGSRTKTGRPILANDPHLGLRTPSVWYLARLEAPGLSVAGA